METRVKLNKICLHLLRNSSFSRNLLLVLWKPCKGHMEPCKGQRRQRCRVPGKAAAHLPRVTDGFATSTAWLIGLGTPTPTPNPPPQPLFSPSPRSQVRHRAAPVFQKPFPKNAGKVPAELGAQGLAAAQGCSGAAGTAPLPPPPTTAAAQMAAA